MKRISLLCLIKPKSIYKSMGEDEEKLKKKKTLLEFTRNLFIKKKVWAWWVGGHGEQVNSLIYLMYD